MKKVFVLTALLLVVAIPALASGVSVAWTNCYGGGGASDMVFACNKNTASEIMHVSFATAADQPGFLGVEVYMRGMVEATVVPDWWKLGLSGSGDCRQGLLSGSCDYTAGPYDCYDPWLGNGAGGVANYSWFDDQMRLILAFALASESPLVAEVENYACKVTILNTKTVGTGACVGCTTPAIWAINELKSAQALSFEMLTTPISEGSQCCTWRSSTLPCGPPVPVRNSTWGQVKSLYR